MREIKFRQPIKDKYQKFIEWWYWGFIDGHWISPAIHQNGNDTRKESQQFTGLHDKNGKEIYEGDIVKCHDHPTGVDDGVGNVYYKGGAYMVTNTMIHLGDFGSAWVEIVGNLYETPELLNQTESK